MQDEPRAMTTDSQSRKQHRSWLVVLHRLVRALAWSVAALCALIVLAVVAGTPLGALAFVVGLFFAGIGWCMSAEPERPNEKLTDSRRP